VICNVQLTNARGFCAELATAITVAIASRYGNPPHAAYCRLGQSNTACLAGRQPAACSVCLQVLFSCRHEGLWPKCICPPAHTCDVGACAGLPISTTQTITGGLLAIGLFEGLKGVNWRAVSHVLCTYVTLCYCTVTIRGVYPQPAIRSCL
jgi:hypothetical protein